MREKLVTVTTTAKLIAKAKATGTLNLSIVSYLGMLSYYIEYLTALPRTQENADKLITLKNMFGQTMNKCNDVCTYRIALNTLCKTDAQMSVFSNNPPTVGDASKIYTPGVYQFVYSDFTTDFNDPDQGDVPKFVEIFTLPATGTIKYSGIAITEGYILNIKDIVNLTYELVSNPSSVMETSFLFKISDSNAAPLYSTPAVFSFDLSSSTTNLPATIGDNTITVAPSVVTQLTLAMFTSDTTTPYYDPEGDLIDAIRIDRLHSTNTGVFYLEGVPVSNGAIITREQFETNAFYHIGDDVETVATDGFEFSARDEGSQIWVQ